MVDRHQSDELELTPVDAAFDEPDNIDRWAEEFQAYEAKRMHDEEFVGPQRKRRAKVTQH